MSPRERLLVGVISRYHRKAPPSKRHPEFTALTPEERRQVRRLAALLRVADGLDRGHVAAVEKVRLRLTATRLLIEAVPRLATTDLKLEIWGASRKADLLEKLLGVDVLIRAARVAEPAPRPAAQ
jgi:exopolyphosphatase/guanosine-5'-triphosphate,3'-diphosphate pyrophosphatase